jgi:zinc protease
VAESYLVQSNRTFGTYVPTESPQRAPLPDPVDLQAVLKDYHGDKNATQGEAFDATAVNIDARTQRTVLDLPNGPVKLALLPKATRGGVVSAQLLIQFGDADTLRGLRDVAYTTASLIDHGTATLSRQQIEDRFDALRADVSISGSANDVVATLSTTRDNLAPSITLVLDLLRNASFPADQLDEFQRRELSSIENERQEPTALVRRALARNGNPWPADDLRYVPTLEEKEASTKALNRDALVQFHQRFYGAGRISLTAVGDFDVKPVQQALAEGLSGWQRAPAYQRISDPYRPVDAKRFELPVPDKANAFYTAVEPVALQDTSPDFAAAYLANYLLGSSETSRLWARVREREGLSYNVRSILSASSYEPAGKWTIYAIYAPSNRAKLETAIREELERALRDGFTADEVRDGIASVINLRKLSRAQDKVLVRAWTDYLDQDRTFAFSANLDKQFLALTPDQVNAALRKYLKPDGFSTAVSGDFRPK